VETPHYTDDQVHAKLKLVVDAAVRSLQPDELHSYNRPKRAAVRKAALEILYNTTGDFSFSEWFRYLPEAEQDRHFEPLLKRYDP
jgi:hypothetical protein